MKDNEVITPGATIGILGDGQLGRMLAHAAQRLGYKVAVLGPGGRDSSAGQVTNWAKAWEADGNVSQELLNEFCSLVSVVLIEWENVPVELIKRVEACGIPVRPNADVLAITQDRILEKQCARKGGIAVPQHEYYHRNLLYSHKKTDHRPYPTILKTTRNGYDGKGQIRIPTGDSINSAWHKLERQSCILEEQIDFLCELSVIVARSPVWSNVVHYGPFLNIHQDGILRVTHFPPDLQEPLLERLSKKPSTLLVAWPNN